MPTEYLHSTAVILTGISPESPHIRFEVPINERFNRTVSGVVYTLSMCGSLRNGAFTHCERCNVRPKRIWFLVDTMEFDENQQIWDSVDDEVMCDTCTQRLIKPSLYQDYARQMRRERSLRTAQDRLRSMPISSEWPPPPSVYQAPVQAVMDGGEIDIAESLGTATFHCGANPGGGVTDPAEPSIPNGIYFLNDMQFQIYTIQRSRSNPDLNGKRVMRWKRGDGWQAFAFLTRGGTLQVWNRYRHVLDPTNRSPERTDWLHANQLVALLGLSFPYQLREGTAGQLLWSIGTAWYRSGRQLIRNSEPTIKIHLMCMKCNTTCTGTDMGWCPDHLPSAPTYHTIGRIESLRRERQRERMRQALTNMRDRREIPIVAELTELALDQLGAGEIL